jgi:hypothetical protein
MKRLETKGMNYLKGIGSENVFEMTVVDLLDFKCTLA